MIKVRQIFALIGLANLTLAQADDSSMQPVVERDDFHVVDTADGTLYFYSYQGDKPPAIVARNSDGEEILLVADEIDWNIEPELSPGGAALIFASGQSMAALSVKQIDIASGMVSTVVGEAGRSFSAPTYFPDGQRIAYNELHTAAGTSSIWVADRDGNNAVKLQTGLSGRQEQPDVSPDGRYIVFSGAPKGADTQDLFVYDLELKKTHQITHTDHYERFPVFSPDGASIWFSLDQGQGFEVASVPLEMALAGEAVAKVRWSAPDGDAFFVRFSRDDKTVLVSHGDWGRFKIARISLDEMQ